MKFGRLDLIALVLGVLLITACTMALIPIDARLALDPSKAIRVGSHGLVIEFDKAQLPANFPPSDDNEHAKRSTLRLFLNGAEVGPSHSDHQTLSGPKGLGAFSHWGDGILFSWPKAIGGPQDIRQVEVAWPLLPERGPYRLAALVLGTLFCVAVLVVLQRHLRLSIIQLTLWFSAVVASGLIILAVAPLEGRQSLDVDFISTTGGVHTLALARTPQERPFAFPQGDTSEQPGTSPLKLYVNGIAAGPPHSAPEAIANQGGGLYLHWHDTLMFSMPGSAAGQPGEIRTLEIRWPIVSDTAPLRVGSIVFLLVALVSAAFIVRDIRGRAVLTSLAVAIAGYVGYRFYDYHDISHRLNAHSPETFLALRERLTHHVWGSNGAPVIWRPTAEEIISPPDWLPPNVRVVTAHAPDEDYPAMFSRLFLLEAEAKADCLFVYNFGHGGGFLTGVLYPTEKSLIRAMLISRCDVVVSAMPLHGDNASIAPNIPGARGDQPHSFFENIETSSFSPIRFFLDPPTKAISWATRRNGTYARIGMAGTSGGGWTTTFSAALDPRIARSYAIAGSVPMFMRERRPADLGDWEQSQAKWLQLAKYLDLYVLGALETSRKAMLFHNVQDTCCYRADQLAAYAPQLTQIAASLNAGSLSFISVPGAQHAPTQGVVDQIVADFTGDDWD